MKKVFPVVFIALMLSGGCNPTQNDIVIFPDSKQATMTATAIGQGLAMPTNLIIQGDDILIHDLKTEWLLKSFSREQLAFNGNLLRRGRGPMEEVDVMPSVRRYAEDTFMYQATGSVKVAGIRHDHDEAGLVVFNEYALPPNMNEDYESFLLDDKLCSANSWVSSSIHDFRCFNLGADSIYEWGELLPMQRPESFHPDEPFHLYKMVTLSPDRNMLAVAYATLPILRIYDAQSGRMLHELQMADDAANRKIMEGNKVDGLITYYWQLKSTSQYIYALYPGANLSWEGENVPDLASVLHIWKWDGTPVMTLELDRPVMAFDVTPDNKHIIASSIVDVDKLFMAEIPW